MLPPLPELTALERIIELGAGKLETRVACEVKMPQGDSYPVHVIALGNPDPKVPAVGYFGGVHGLERIGAGVVIAYLQSLVMRLQWDSTLHKQLLNRSDWCSCPSSTLAAWRWAHAPTRMAWI